MTFPLMDQTRRLAAEALGESDSTGAARRRLAGRRLDADAHGPLVRQRDGGQAAADGVNVDEVVGPRARPSRRPSRSASRSATRRPGSRSRPERPRGLRRGRPRRPRRVTDVIVAQPGHGRGQLRRLSVRQ